MRKIDFGFIAVLTMFITFSFTSCEDDDGYSLGKFVISLATVNPIDDSAGTYYLTMDNGTTLWPAASNVLYKPKNNQRVLVNFTVLGDSVWGYDHPVKINSLQEILTKKIENLTEENEDEIGDDAIRILDRWIGDDYLNIHFGYNTGGEQKHRISLVHNKIDPPVSETGEIILELRHNTYGDPQKYGTKGYAAYDLKPLQKEGQESVDLIIKVQDFNNEEKKYRVTYTYKNKDGQSTDNKTLKDMPEVIEYF